MEHEAQATPRSCENHSTTCLRLTLLEKAQEKTESNMETLAHALEQLNTNIAGAIRTARWVAYTVITLFVLHQSGLEGIMDWLKTLLLK